MSQPHFSSYEGLGEWAKANMHYSQAVRIGNTIKTSGQGGWHPTTEPISISSNLDTEIDQAFANVDLALKTAGGKGWSQVYSVRSFHVALDEQTTAAMVSNLRKWCGEDHMPIWTEIGVSTLALEAMRVEIEVEAYVG
ncbi:hypothetical protein WHR41_05544 [Cladosporium halotolerans]|uniref:Uncharacterized protein n=1 Tax=Cladosporium halotolerans TaxID=1052096 RepID=A0AB34KML9_9PEZI